MHREIPVVYKELFVDPIDVLVENDQPLRLEDQVLLLRHQSDKVIAAAFVDASSISLVQNFVHWMELLQYQHYLLIFNDEFIFKDIENITHGILIPFEGDKSDPNQPLSFKLSILERILKLNTHLLWTQVHSIWFDNPLDYIDTASDVQGFVEGEGLLFIKSNDATKSYLASTSACLEKNTRDRETFGIYAQGMQKSLRPYLKCFDTSSLKYAKLPSDRFPSANEFFAQLIPQKRGVYPIVIHSDDISAELVKKRYQKWNLWKPEKLVPVKKEIKHVPPIYLHVITFNRLESLKRLLGSLLNASYLGETVDLRISVDFPSMDNPLEVLKRNEIIRFLKTFHWPFGSFFVQDHQSHLGLFSQWIKSHDNFPASSMVLVLEDDLEVSPLFYEWTRKALEFYWNSDLPAYISGIVLDQPHIVLGKGYRTPLGKPEEILRRKKYFESVYLNQAFSTWGTLIFPRHWNAFLQYVKENRINSPCIPNLISSRWYKRNPKAVWSIWFHNFAFDNGLLTITPNNNISHALVINHRERGLNFKSVTSPIGKLQAKGIAKDFSFPSLSEAIKVDFQFIPIRSIGTLRFRNRIFPQSNAILPDTRNGSFRWDPPDFDFLNDRCKSL